MIEVFGFVITVISIFLATREHVAYYPTGMVSVLLYAWIYFGARLYAESVLQILWLLLMAYGWYEWLYGGADRTQLPVRRTPAWEWLAIGWAGIFVTAAVYWVQKRYTNNPNPLVDSAIFAWSLAAQWMTARKYLENWLLWIAINIVAVPLYIYRDLKLTAVLYAILLVLGIEGYRKWRRSLVSA
jgi:nicotinamide mononucleotide transporter